ncbi:MAG: LacI family DNA-binding transcriptional regulator [Planctomycetota bacterium]
MSATIDQIARRAGVSTSTVARVLRGDVKGAHRRSARRVQEILKISEEMGYHPNWRARALSRGKTHTIGLLYANPKWIFEDPMNELAVSFTESLKEHNYELRMIPANTPDNWKESVLGGAVDGLVLMQHTPDTVREAVEKSGLPTVLLGDKLDIGAPQVYPDDVAGAFTATRHLIGLGHKRIAFFVNDTIRDHHSVPERQAGFEKAMAQAGLAESAQVWRTSFDEALRRLTADDRPTALIGYCHVEALRIAHLAWSVGLSIPTELSLIAFNDTWVTECMTPALTVVGFDREDMGRRGAEMLVSQIESPDDPPPPDVVIPEKLIVRGTTAPPYPR